MLFRSDETFGDCQAALIEPLATPVHAVRLVGELTGKKVVILGTGTIGLLTLIAVRRAGATMILSTDSLTTKLLSPWNSGLTLWSMQEWTTWPGWSEASSGKAPTLSLTA